jgi:multidrug efflux pump subunit AcrA (membrane-fusion protein)
MGDSIEAQLSLITEVKHSVPIAGLVKTVLVQEGMTVRVGQELLRLDDELARKQVTEKQLEAEVAQAQSRNEAPRRYGQATLRVHESELVRSKSANQQFRNSVSETELRRLELLVDQSQLTIEQAERDQQIAGLTAAWKRAATETAETLVEKHTVKSAIDGIVVQVETAPGEWLNAGDSALRIIQLDRLRAEAFVDGKRYGSELLGTVVRFRILDGSVEGSPLEVEGRVTFVSPEVHPVTGQIRIWCEIDNGTGRLRPGVRGFLELNLQRVARP